MADVNLSFSPVPSLARMFTATPEDLFIFVLGPVGSTKTTSCLYWLLTRATMQEPSPDGIRRTRFAIVRSTLVELKRTILKDALSLFGQIADWRVGENTLYFKIADVESEWIFVPLDTLEDQKRLLSLQLSGVYINEGREIEFSLMMQSFTRTGRYPSVAHGGVTCTHRFLLCDSNMGVKGSALYKFLEEQRPEELMYIHQPPALSPEADWLQFLPANYYGPMLLVNTQAWINTHIGSEWSFDLSGEPVYAGVFDQSYHVAARTLLAYSGYPLLVGVDPGLHPAALICQMSNRSQLNVLQELHAPNLLFSTFLDEHLIPTLQTARFAMRPAYLIADPTAVNRSALAANSAYGMMEDKGFDVFVASTNDIDPRIRATERYFVENRGHSYGEGRPDPAIIIDPDCCPVLIAALSGEYRYKRKKSGELEVTPEKKHPTSDVVDCLGYVALGAGTSRVRRRLAVQGRFGTSTGVQKPPPVRGWT